MSSKLDEYIPGQFIGKETETTESVIADNEKAAIILFQSAMDKLLDINNWHQLCGFLSTSFRLTDYSGEPIAGKASVGNYIRIDIPGPGTKTGRGFDWVRIEKIKHIVLDFRQEIFCIQVRPAPYPLSKDNEVAHFFRDSATSSFMLIREIRQITAAVYGRNEVPNTEVDDVIDKIRNSIIANTGTVGFSIMQWKSLVSSVIKTSISDLS